MKPAPGSVAYALEAYRKEMASARRDAAIWELKKLVDQATEASE
jgi:hypothetical protein